MSTNLITSYFSSKKKMFNIQQETYNKTNIEKFLECSNINYKIPRNNGIYPITPYNIENIESWIFPEINEFRKYQFQICQTCLFSNTLVCLPTGLGKTFIAAVIMFNYYRWFIKGIVFFLAPTKPLVDQQYEAYKAIIVKNNTENQVKYISQLTGKQTKAQREYSYKTSRILFMTPQTLANDLDANLIKETNITCIIFDEAHRAIGNYAYCKIVQHLEKAGVGYRIIALTATPGSDEKAIQQIISNLCIAKIEARDENDADVKKYSHNKNLEIIKITKTSELASIEKLAKEVVLIPQKFLQAKHLLPRTKGNCAVNKMTVLEWQTKFKETQNDFKERNGSYEFGIAMSCFSSLLSLISGYNMLKTHGIETFKSFADKFSESAKNKKSRSVITEGSKYKELLEKIKEIHNVDTKLIKAKEVLHKYYSDPQQKSSQTIIFTMFVDSARAIANFFANDDVVKAELFIGQANGFSQKQQIKIISDFRRHCFNTLVATCIGEEGLDIGHVNLIISYDCTCSPIRMIQRFGRTGRKEEGKIVILLSEDEERKYKEMKRKSMEVYRILGNYTESVYGETLKRKQQRTVNGYKFEFYGYNSRMIREDIDPKPLYNSNKVEEQTLDEGNEIQKILETEDSLSYLFEDESKEIEETKVPDLIADLNDKDIANLFEETIRIDKRKCTYNDIKDVYNSKKYKIEN